MDMFTLKMTIFFELCILTMHMYKEVHMLEDF
jgi:hypothetical protein